MPSLELTFLGTGTSQGVPAIGCECPVCLSVDPRDNRTRTSILIQTRDTSIVIDTTPEFRIQCLRERVMRLDAALFTHAHSDHIMGFDDMRRFCEMEDRKMPIYATASTMEQLRNNFRYAFDDPKPWKNYLRLDPHTIDYQRPFQIGGLTILPLEVPHGQFITTGYVIHQDSQKLLAYFTDCSEVPESVRKVAQGVEILILDALRDTTHPTHMTFEQAISSARSICPTSTYLIHMSHDVLHAAKQDELPEGFHLAYDGLKVTAGK